MYPVSHRHRNCQCRNLPFFSFYSATNRTGPGHHPYRNLTITHTIELSCTSDRPVAKKKPPPNNTQHSQQTDINASVWIRTRNPSKQAAADPRLRPRGHWDRQEPDCCTFHKHVLRKYWNKSTLRSARKTSKSELVCDTSDVQPPMRGGGGGMILKKNSNANGRIQALQKKNLTILFNRR